MVKRGFKAEVVRIPFKWYPRIELLKSCLAWRLVDLTESDGQPIDLVIATKFPTYMVKHPNKVVWLFHQYRQVYDLYGTEYSEFTSAPEDQAFRTIIARMDRQCLGEAQRIFTNSGNTAARLARYNGLIGEPLYHPPRLAERFYNEEYQGYILFVSRMNTLKRGDLLIRAMRHIRSPAQCLMVGEGAQRQEWERLAEQLGLADRVKFLGRVEDDELIRLYANCLAVFFAPFDEDYGYVTLEAFYSCKPVITTNDAGGVLEFVEDGRSGFVTAPDPRQVAESIDKLFENRSQAAEMGHQGYERVKSISWDHVIEKLTA